jgi:hypothetical protein
MGGPVGAATAAMPPPTARSPNVRRFMAAKIHREPAPGQPCLAVDNPGAVPIIWKDGL